MFSKIRAKNLYNIFFIYMKDLQIIIAFVFALCVASQINPPPPKYHINSLSINGEQQYQDGRPVPVPVEPKKSSKISSSTSILSTKYLPPPPPRQQQLQPQPIILLVHMSSSMEQQCLQLFSKKAIVIIHLNHQEMTQDPQGHIMGGLDNPLPNDQQIDQNNIPQIISGDDSKTAQSPSPPFKDIFDPKDQGLKMNTCVIVRYFAFRIGTNKDAPSRYLTAPNLCQNGNLVFTYASSSPLDTQLFTAYERSNSVNSLLNDWLFESKTCPGYYIRITPSPWSILKLTQHPFSSSKFRIHKWPNSKYIQSLFYTSRYWTGWSSVQLNVNQASQYIVQYWP